MSTRIIDEVREVVANVVAKKQDAAKINFPKIIEKIKAQAALGLSECKLAINEMNEYDKKLLEAEGFRVSMRDREKSQYEKHDYFNKYIGKEWIINW